MDTIKSPTRIEKENISTLKFPNEEVLNEVVAIKERTRELDNAQILGNTEHRKIKIIFQDESNVYQVETTVWATTEKNIVLKAGVSIPINRILKVNIY
jgi:hypothetical protein